MYFCRFFLFFFCFLFFCSTWLTHCPQPVSTKCLRNKTNLTHKSTITALLAYNPVITQGSASARWRCLGRSARFFLLRWQCVEHVQHCHTPIIFMLWPSKTWLIVPFRTAYEVSFWKLNFCAPIYSFCCHVTWNHHEHFIYPLVLKALSDSRITGDRRREFKPLHCSCGVSL